MQVFYSVQRVGVTFHIGTKNDCSVTVCTNSPSLPSSSHPLSLSLFSPTRLPSLTMVAEVIHQYNLVEEFLGGPVDDTGDGAQEDSVCLIMEDDHHRGSWEVRGILAINTAGERFDI